MRVLWLVVLISCHSVVLSKEHAKPSPPRVSSAVRQYRAIRDLEERAEKKLNDDDNERQVRRAYKPLEPLGSLQPKAVLTRSLDSLLKSTAESSPHPHEVIHVSGRELTVPLPTTDTVAVHVNKTHADRDLENINGELAEAGHIIEKPRMVKYLSLPVVTGPLMPIKTSESAEVNKLNTELDIMKPKGISIFGSPGRPLYLGEIRTRRYAPAYHGHLGTLQPGDSGSRGYQWGESRASPVTQEAIDVGESFDTRPIVVTPITKAKYLSPNIRHTFMPGFFWQGMCADPKTGLPFPCQKYATSLSAPSKEQAEALNYDPFGVNRSPWYSKKKWIEPPNLMH